MGTLRLGDLQQPPKLHTLFGKSCGLKDSPFSSCAIGKKKLLLLLKRKQGRAKHIAEGSSSPIYGVFNLGSELLQEVHVL